MPEVENLVQPIVEPVKSPGDELPVDEWLQQRRAAATPAPSPVESKTAEATEPSQQEQERDETGKFKPKEEPEGKVSPGVQKRIDKAIAQQRQAERERDEALQKLQTAKPAEQPKPAEVVDLKAPVKPQLKDFAEWEQYDEAKDKYYEELADYKAKTVLAADRKERSEAEAKAKAEEQGKVVESEWSKSEEAAREAHPDYDEKVAEVKAEIQAGKFEGLDGNVLGAIVSSDAKAELLYHLVTNLDELKRISKVPLHMVGYELGKLEARLQSPVAPEKPTPEKPSKPPVKALPTPPEPVTGKAAASSGPSETDSPEDWAAKRTQQRQAKGKLY